MNGAAVLTPMRIRQEYVGHRNKALRGQLGRCAGQDVRRVMTRQIWFGEFRGFEKISLTNAGSVTYSN